MEKVGLAQGVSEVKKVANYSVVVSGNGAVPMWRLHCGQNLGKTKTEIAAELEAIADHLRMPNAVNKNIR